MNPLATNHPISHIKSLLQAEKLDLSPSFQRRPVWSDAQASYLIDSILSGLPIPEIYIRTITDDEGNEVQEVVDGQQRLRSIIRFFRGDFSLKGENVSQVWLGVDWESLPKKIKTQFWQYKLVVRELHGASDAEVIDMFRRLNANAATLNDQELRHAQYQGAFIKTVEAISESPWWLEKRIVTHAQVRRMVDVEFIAELLAGLIGGPMEKKTELDSYFLDYDDELDQYWPYLFEKTRTATAELLEEDFTGWRTKTEFYSLFLAVGLLIYDESYIDKDDLAAAQKRLAKFRKSVDGLKRGTAKRVPKQVTEYYEAVKRASTDKSRRAKRIEIVQAVIQGQ